MSKICKNPECNNDISHKRNLAKFCSAKCCRKLFSLNNKDKIIAYDKKKYQKHKENIKLKTREYAIKNKEKVKKWKENYSLKNKERIKKNKRLYFLNNREYYRHLYNVRRAKKLQATPKFADLNKIKEIYKNCPKGYEVDHIIPLINKNVCGLHVEWNLQYLTSTENRRKGNRF